MNYCSLSQTKLIGRHIIYRADCASTNTLAVRHLSEGALLPEGTVIITDHQWQGRGQGNNNWQSEPYKNLTFSLILHPTFLTVQQSFSLSITTSVAIREALSVYVSNSLTNKWPNDIYHRDQKVGGVLIENVIRKQRIKTSVIGIGININQQHFRESKPTSLANICKKTFNLQHVLAQVLTTLEHCYLQLRSQGIAPLKATYLESMYWINEDHVFQEESHLFRGKIRGVNNSGQLLVEKEQRILKAYNLKDITFIA